MLNQPLLDLCEGSKGISRENIFATVWFFLLAKPIFKNNDKPNKNHNNYPPNPEISITLPLKSIAWVWIICTDLKNFNFLQHSWYFGGLSCWKHSSCSWVCTTTLTNAKHVNITSSFSSTFIRRETSTRSHQVFGFIMVAWLTVLVRLEPFDSWWIRYATVRPAHIVFITLSAKRHSCQFSPVVFVSESKWVKFKFVVGPKIFPVLRRKPSFASVVEEDKASVINIFPVSSLFIRWVAPSRLANHVSIQRVESLVLRPLCISFSVEISSKYNLVQICETKVFIKLFLFFARLFVGFLSFLNNLTNFVHNLFVLICNVIFILRLLPTQGLSCVVNIHVYILSVNWVVPTFELSK